MARRLRNLCVLLATAALLAGTAAPPAAQATTSSKESVSELDPTVDAFLLRPLGIVATVVGTGLFVGSSPFYLVTRPHEIDEPFKTFVARPAVWTWGRPLGGN